MRKFWLSGNEKYDCRFYLDKDEVEYVGFWIDTREKVIEHINNNPHLLEECHITITHKPDPFTVTIEEFMREYEEDDPPTGNR